MGGVDRYVLVPHSDGQHQSGAGRAQLDVDQCPVLHPFGARMVRRAAPRRIASHRIASHRIASHRSLHRSLGGEREWEREQVSRRRKLTFVWLCCFVVLCCVVLCCVVLCWFCLVL
jgi:hypothetical protein